MSSFFSVFRVVFRVLPVCALVACSANDTCALLGTYTGTFEGDASGDLRIVLSESADGSDPIVDITLSGDTFDGVGHSTFHCEDGELIVTLLDDDHDGKADDPDAMLRRSVVINPGGGTPTYAGHGGAYWGGRGF